MPQAHTQVLEQIVKYFNVVSEHFRERADICPANFTSANVMVINEIIKYEYLV